ncbi:hypothetical protein TNCV_4957261 [Trichonephila clavipes]|nr:hypothetical protein TNCV_4957261 [Trichonephila clavipes]
MFLADTLSRAFPVSETVREDPEMLNIVHTISKHLPHQTVNNLFEVVHFDIHFTIAMCVQITADTFHDVPHFG